MNVFLVGLLLATVAVLAAESRHHGDHHRKIIIDGGHHHGHNREIIIDGGHHHGHHSHHHHRHSGEIVVDIPHHGHHHHHHSDHHREVVVEVPSHHQHRNHHHHHHHGGHHAEVIVEQAHHNHHHHRHSGEVVVDIERDHRHHHHGHHHHHHETPCSRKANVFVHRLPPIELQEQARHVNVRAGKALVVKTPPVVIHRQGQVKHEEHVVRHRPAPVYLTEEITKVVRPVHKRVYVEKFLRKEYPCKDEIVHRRLVKEGRPCGCRHSGSSSSYSNESGDSESGSDSSESAEVEVSETVQKEVKVVADNKKV